MFSLGSFKLFTTDSISKDLSPSEYVKTEKRLKELSGYLGLHSKQSWPSQLTSIVKPSTGQPASLPAQSLATSSTNLPGSINSTSNCSNNQHQYHSTFANGSVERIVSIHWNDVYKSLVIILSNGLIAYCFFHPVYLNSINYIYLDKHLIGKIKTEYMVDFIYDNRMILISYTNPRITCILLDDKHRNKGWISRKRKLFKLKSQNVKIIEHELDTNCGRRVERHLLKSEIKNDDEDLLLVWWQNGSSTVCPWSSPITSNKDFCNILIYNLIRDSFDLVGYASILNDILKICFCKRRVNRLMTIESDGDPCSILYREYQINLIDDCYILDLVESIQLTVPSLVIKADVNFDLNKVCLLCEDRNVLIYSIDQNSIRYFQAPINAINLINSPLDSYFILADSFGQIMMYDYGLHVMPANYDDLFLREAFTGLNEMKFVNNSLVYLRFTDDPNIMLIVLPLNLDYIGLIRSYVKHDYINEAIENVQLLNWNLNSYLAYSSLNIIFNCLLRSPLNSIKESQLQEALASFFIPKIPIAEDIIEEYQYEMHCIAKRFFYHLYRYSCLEKAFLLALDLKSRHLFLLLHKTAKERGNDKLASVSLQNAHKFHSSSLSSSLSPSSPHQLAINDKQQTPETLQSDSSQSTLRLTNQLRPLISSTSFVGQKINSNQQVDNNNHSVLGLNHLVNNSTAYQHNDTSSPNQMTVNHLITFKPVRKESSSANSSDSIAVYSSPRKRNEIITHKLSKSVYNNSNGKTDNNLPTINIESSTESTQSGYSVNQFNYFVNTNQFSEENQQKHINIPSSILPVDLLKENLSMRSTKPPQPPPLPPKVKNKLNSSSNHQNLINNQPVVHISPQLPFTSGNTNKGIIRPTNTIINSTTTTTISPNHNNHNYNPQNPDQSDKSNIPVPINYLMKSHINTENPKIECIHYGLV